MKTMKRKLKSFLRLTRDGCIALAARRIDREVCVRDSRRGEESRRWFLSAEEAVAKALANIIVPTDSETPGVDDIDVLGPSVIELLDQLISGSEARREAYSRGLLAFDLWARRMSGS